MVPTTHEERIQKTLNLIPLIKAKILEDLRNPDDFVKVFKETHEKNFVRNTVQMTSISIYTDL